MYISEFCFVLLWNFFLLPYTLWRKGAVLIFLGDSSPLFSAKALRELAFSWWWMVSLCQQIVLSPVFTAAWNRHKALGPKWMRGFRDQINASVVVPCVVEGNGPPHFKLYGRCPGWGFGIFFICATPRGQTSTNPGTAGPQLSPWIDNALNLFQFFF